MNCRLRTYSQNPPGGFLYEQTGDKPRKFKAEPVITALAALVSSYRTANNLPRAGIQETLVDVDRYQCARLGGDRAWCTCEDGDPNAVALSPSSPYVSSGCAGCGAKL